MSNEQWPVPVDDPEPFNFFDFVDESAAPPNSSFEDQQREQPGLSTSTAFFPQLGQGLPLNSLSDLQTQRPFVAQDSNTYGESVDQFSATARRDYEDENSPFFPRQSDIHQQYPVPSTNDIFGPQANINPGSLEVPRPNPYYQLPGQVPHYEYSNQDIVGEVPSINQNDSQQSQRRGRRKSRQSQLLGQTSMGQNQDSEPTTDPAHEQTEDYAREVSRDGSQLLEQLEEQRLHHFSSPKEALEVFLSPHRDPLLVNKADDDVDYIFENRETYVERVYDAMMADHNDQISANVEFDSIVKQKGHRFISACAALTVDAVIKFHTQGDHLWSAVKTRGDLKFKATARMETLLEAMGAEKRISISLTDSLDQIASIVAEPTGLMKRKAVNKSGNDRKRQQLARGKLSSEPNTDNSKDTSQATTQTTSASVALPPRTSTRRSTRASNQDLAPAALPQMLPTNEGDSGQNASGATASHMRSTDEADLGHPEELGRGKRRKASTVWYGE